MSSTSPISSSNVTRSPMRIGWVIASRIPAIALASVWRAAKPTTRPSTAEDASRPVASRFTDGNCASASASPSTRMIAKTSLRTRRRRVTATGESCSTRCTRRDSARSTSWAATMASSSVAAAVSSLRCSVTNEAAMLKSAPDMAYQANQRAGAAARALLRPLRASPALRGAWAPFWLSRTAIVWVAVFAAIALGPGQGGLAAENAAKFDEPALTQAFGGALSPLARWDAVWYLRIADSGYGGSQTKAAFFPLYPLLVRGGGELLGGSHGARLLAAYLISLAALLAALVLLWRLVSLELGNPLARPTLLLLAVFPAALYFGAPYSESLFLLASVGAFYAARTGSWAWAGAAAGAATATRSAGILLLVPVALLWWGQGQGRRARDLAWLALGPLCLAAYSLHLGLVQGDPLAFLDVQDAWYRELAGPLGGVWDGLVAAFDGARQLLSGSREPVYFEAAGGDPFSIAAINVTLFGFLVFALAACVGVWRRLPPAYGAWVTVALLLPLSFPVGPQPLMSLPRFLAVLFPIFIWLGLVCEERRLTHRVAAAFAVGLGLFTAQFASWHWIA